MKHPVTPIVLSSLCLLFSLLSSAQALSIDHTLSLGSRGEDVASLQTWLARDSSIYPEGLVTGYYGALTEAAVQRLQEKTNIVSSGAPESTGYGVVGPRTRALIENLDGPAAAVTNTKSSPPIIFQPVPPDASFSFTSWLVTGMRGGLDQPVTIRPIQANDLEELIKELQAAVASLDKEVADRQGQAPDQPVGPSSPNGLNSSVCHIGPKPDLDIWCP